MSKASGDHYETLACRFLQQQGLTLVERNWHCRQGELDLVCPPVTAYRLSRALPNARLRLLNAGHGGLSAPLASALCEETDRLRERIKGA